MIKKRLIVYSNSKNSTIIFTAFGEIDHVDNSKVPNMYKIYELHLVNDKLKKYVTKLFLNL